VSHASPDTGRLIADAVTRIGQGDHDGAERLLAAALAQTPRHPVAIYLRGLIACEKADWARAETLLRQALALAPGQPKIVLLLFQALRAQNRGGEAEAPLRQALATAMLDAQTRADLEQALGQVLKLARRHAEALALMQVASRRAPPDREQTLEQANVLRTLGRANEAGELYEALLAADPLALDVHIMLSEMRGGGRPDFVAALDKAAAQRPGRVELPVTKGHLLLRAERLDEAQEAFRQALKIAPDHVVALMGLGRALDRLNDEAGARAAFAKSIAVAPDDGQALEASAGFLLRHGDGKQAQDLAETAHARAPQAQNILALLDLCWRARGDGRAEWLNDYARDVAVFDLEPPDGYADMESFNRDLALHLGAVHDHAQQYLTQTLRGGTQTHDELFHNGHALVDRLLPRIHDAIRAYVAGWRWADGHPFTARRGQGFRHAGSWSSRLVDCGFHVNHFHTKGWISSCYYVGVPEIVADEPQGWIKFGEAADEFGPAFKAARRVQPRPGRLVLFPSYMWHGTMPFRSPQSRLTIAFDALPA
jgi:Flp pilus assembly protein TadD